jgi:hypothetical protein
MGDNPNSTEDYGYAFVQETCADSKAIWHPRGKDVGIDGFLEFRREDGRSAILGVQVKSGKSYFSRPTSAGFVQRPGKGKLASWNIYTVPVIYVIYDHERKEGFWVNVQQFVEDNPDSLKTGRLVVPRKEFNRAALDELRRDARLVRCPVLSETSVREFLELNRGIELVGFVELVRNVLNQTTFDSRPGIPEIEYLRCKGLLVYQPNPNGGLGRWKPTAKGVDYVHFMLGDRYFTPFILVKPARPISDEDLAMCLDFQQYIAKYRKVIPETSDSLADKKRGNK